jgi:dTDP-4-dehydrorhamnose 3,5-epimerase-like enzyme
MAYITELKTFTDERGCLTVIEKELPFEVKRIFYIYNIEKDSQRAKHRHHKTIQALVCFNGSCNVYNNDGRKKEIFILDNPGKCLILEPKDWHIIDNFTRGTILMVFASEYFDPKDYIYEDYPDSV